MPFIYEPGPHIKSSRPKPDRQAAAVTEEQLAAQIAISSPKEKAWGRLDERIGHISENAYRWAAIGAVAAFGAAAAYVGYNLKHTPPIAPDYHAISNACVEALPPGLAEQNPSEAIAQVQACHDNNKLGGGLLNASTTTVPSGPQN